MKKMVLAGMGAALVSLLGACGGLSLPDSEASSGSQVARTYVLNGETLSAEAVAQLVATHQNVYYYPSATGEDSETVTVFLERAALNAFLGGIVKPQFCTGKSTSTVYDLENYNTSGASETFGVNDDETDLRNNTKPGGGTTWWKDISSIKSGSCITTILYKDLNFQGASWVFTGQNEKTLGSFNNAVQSIELF